MSATKFEKGTAETYYFKADGSWALIVVDEARKCFFVNSDFGAWAYFWSHPGRPFKEFLASISKDYLVNKLSRGKREWDEEATKEAFRKAMADRLREFGRERPFTKDEIREMREEGIGIIADSQNAIICYERLSQSEVYNKLFEGNWDWLAGIVRMQDCRDTVAFAEKVYYPLFVPKLKEELAACTSTSSSPS